MGIYSTRPGRLAGQIIGDLFVLGWSIVWALVGIFVNQVVAVLAVPARETARTATRLMDNMREAAEQAARVPGVGDDLRRPFDCGLGHAGQRDRPRPTSRWRASSGSP